MEKKQVAIITGGSSGIGKGLAKEFAKYMDVYLLARNVDKLQETKNELEVNSSYSISIQSADVTATGVVEGIIDKNSSLYNEIYFVNNGGRYDSFEYWKDESTYDLYEKSRSVHQDAPIRLMFHIIKNYAGTQKMFNIVNNLSHASFRTLGFGAVYAPFKSAVMSAATELRLDLKNHGDNNISIYNFYPSSIATKGTLEMINSGVFKTTPLSVEDMAKATIDAIIHRKETDFYVGNVEEKISGLSLKGDEGKLIVPFFADNPLYRIIEKRKLD